MPIDDNSNCEHELTKKSQPSASRELDAYISSEENLYGEIIFRKCQASKCQPDSKILESLIDLKSRLEKDKSQKEEAYEYLKKSNKTMKKIIAKLQEDMKLCRVDIQTEFLNFENLSTERLLGINPKCFTTSTPRGKQQLQ
ncbi:uncharacterized protein LOC125501469 [Athalia rosae]|uniref:uncharacterized protein LOC125501469 n=1 Tax=Athalia rosae TaxID=37344 RepID=UPI00203363D5|nr:uncharacterized protein LOC125501469 [Athalia rosae]